MPEKLIVTSALPYANGPIHFGHVVGAYLPADIYVRFRRLLGDDVHFVCGTDEHGVAITLRAEQQGESYEAYVDRWHDTIHATLRGVGIEFDTFSGTAHHRNPFHRDLSQQFFTDLLANGYLDTRSEEQFYNAGLGRFLPDRYVQGRCYVCGFEQARGDECPKCGSWLDAKRLGDPVCTLDGSRPELRSTTHWYLDLPKLRREWLQGWFESKAPAFKPNVRNFVAKAMEDLPERAITRDLPWGVPVPLPDAEGKVLYVWFDAPIGYLSISQQWFAARGDERGFEALWKDPATRLYHFIGKDNITFHVLTFPAMLWGTRRGWVVPENVPANEFFNLEGRKFNTSAGWYVPPDAVAEVPVDAVRYALTTMMPETADTDFSWRDFQARINDELADTYGNLVSRVFRFIERFLDGRVPAREGSPTEADGAILAAAATAADEVAQLLHQFQFRRACTRLMALGAAANRYFDDGQPWATRKSDPARCRRTIRVCAELIRTLAILTSPILPATGARLLAALGVPGQRWTDAGGERLAADGFALEPLPVLFPKVEDALVARESERLATLARELAGGAGDAAAPAPDTPAPAAEAVADAIAFDDFTKVDLRAGTVRKAERHPKADRLLVVEVDLGFERRTIVAGIAESYRPEELIGRRVAVVANLAPRKLRGIESQGMLLAADDGDGLPRLLAAEPGCPDGTRIR